MKRILAISSLFGKPFFGGAEYSIFEFYKHLSRMNFQIDIYTLDKEFYPEIAYKELKNVTIRRFHSKLPHPVLHSGQNKFFKIVSHILDLSLGQKPITLISEFLRNKPDLVITHNLAGWGYFPWLLCRLLKIPIIHDNHDFYLTCVKNTRWKPNRGNCVKSCLECSFRVYATKLFWPNGSMVANSHFLKREIGKCLPKKNNTNIDVIYPPINIKLDKKIKKDLVYDLVYIGRLEESKGILQLLRAIEFTNYKIGVGGEGELQEQLKSKFPNVDILGAVDTFEILNKARVLVVPSLNNEPYGRVVVEGVAVGIPVLISKVGGLNEFKYRDGATVIEFNPKDSKELLEKIEIALKIPRNTSKIKTDWIDQHYNLQLDKFKELVLQKIEFHGNVNVNTQ